MHNLLLSLSQKIFMKYSLALKTAVYLTIHHSAQWKFATSTKSRSDGCSIKFCNDWINIISRTILFTVFILFTNTDFIPLLFHYEVKFFDRLNGAIEHNLKCRKLEKNCHLLQWNACCEKIPKEIISAQPRSLCLPRFLDQLFWKGLEIQSSKC